MKRNSVIYYLLFLLVIWGAFASMAKNEYGLLVIGFSALCFSVMFVVELIFVRTVSEDSSMPAALLYLELAAMAALALVFFLMSMSLFFLPTTILLLSSLVVLIALSILRPAIQILKSRAGTYSPMMKVGFLLFYGSLLFFLLSYLLEIVYPAPAMIVGILGMIFAILFGALAWIHRRSREDEDSIVQKIAGNGKSVILLLGFILVYGYSLLYAAGMLPPFYHGNLPEGYQHLVEKSVTEDSAEEKTKAKLFKERYDAFIKRHGTR